MIYVNDIYRVICVNEMYRDTLMTALHVEVSIPV